MLWKLNPPSCEAQCCREAEMRRGFPFLCRLLCISPPMEGWMDGWKLKPFLVTVLAVKDLAQEGTAGETVGLNK
ncbi:hypothetical protein Z043-106848 [Arapaima gigas]